MSIVSVCEETARLKEVHNSQTILCTLNNEHLLLKHEMFANDTDVFRFEQLAGYFTAAEYVLIHLPEFLVKYFVPLLSAKDKSWITGLKGCHLNIMNQNILLMPDPGIVRSLTETCSTVTITTAHQKYCTQYYRAYYGVPIHKLSVWISPEQYQFTPWEHKEALLVVSPDKHPMKEVILEQLQKIEGLTIQIIQDLTYEEYKVLVSRAKWALTFGEGLDGYFIEPVFSGAVAFAVYNEAFFTPDFQELCTVYASYDNLTENINNDIAAIDKQNAYVPYQRQQFDICARYYSREVYRKNIEAFYLRRYSFE